MSEEKAFIGKQVTFIAPSGYSYTLREQNGEDDDILSNPGDARTLMNISKFIAGIVTSTDVTKSGRLTAEEAHALPTLDRYCILFQSRINSLGNILEFKYPWPIEEGGPREYEVDLDEYLLEYSLDKTKLDEAYKLLPDAIPYYPLGKSIRDIEYVTGTGKQIKFDILSGLSESSLIAIPENDKTKNSELLVRNLKMKVEGEWMKVTRFHLFTPRDMADIRAYIKSVDPIFSARTELENPSTGQKIPINIMGISDFFYLG